MRLRFSIFILIILVIAAACQSNPPPREVLMEVTVVHTEIVVVTVTDSQSTGPIPIQNETVAAQSIEATLTPTETQPEITPTPDIFPTPIVGQILVAEQDFQNAKMFWLQPIEQIWILQTDADGVNIWIVRDDSFEDGIPENNESLTPPAEGLIQPIRGFGFLWRTDDTLRSQIGWATSEEVGYNANYEYHWGGTVDENNEYVSGPGFHQLQTHTQEIYIFDEESRTWEIIEPEATATPVGEEASD